ncbi:superoxide dismutase [Gloeomargaritales cyanobacterium VI4D9]|nr:superoxide dismutase [Gloeomargaritales cyanobacterium VI4D9]
MSAFTVPPLPYTYDALEPVIDRRTMMFHHDKHHAAYVKALNAAITKHPELGAQSVEQLLQNLDKIPTDIQTAVRNHGGGHYNHSLFWESMRPPQTGVPTGALASALAKNFGDLETFQQAFTEAGTRVFGSGWVWLVGDKTGQLQIMTTPNQDSPVSVGFTPLLGNDVWEHAYYLNYQNRRADYLKAWWQVANWPVVEQRYALLVGA